MKTDLSYLVTCVHTIVCIPTVHFQVLIRLVKVNKEIHCSHLRLCEGLLQFKIICFYIL